MKRQIFFIPVLTQTPAVLKIASQWKKTYIIGTAIILQIIMEMAEINKIKNKGFTPLEVSEEHFSKNFRFIFGVFKL